MEEFEKFYNKALRFLSYRPRSEKEIRDCLVRKKASVQISSKVIIKLKDQRFINDEEFTKWWIEQRTKVRPRAIRLVKIELQQKGIQKELIEAVIQNSEFRIQNDLELARELIEEKMKRFRNKFGMTREKTYQKLSRYLASKGFDWETIKKSIDEVLGKGV